MITIDEENISPTLVRTFPACTHILIMQLWPDSKISHLNYTIFFRNVLDYSPELGKVSMNITDDVNHFGPASPQPSRTSSAIVRRRFPSIMGNPGLLRSSSSQSIKTPPTNAIIRGIIFCEGPASSAAPEKGGSKYWRSPSSLRLAPSHVRS